MAAAPRLSGLALVLVPQADLDDRELILVGRMGCRAIFEEGQQPIYPPLLYGVFTSEETLNRIMLRKLTMWWAKRCSNLVLCLPPTLPEEPKLDPLTYDLLIENETQGYVPRAANDPRRLPVHLLSWASGESYNIRRMGRDELDTLFKRNIVSGLLHDALEG